MKLRIWIFALGVAIALALHLVLVSARIAQASEDSVRTRVAQAASSLRAQIELIDARQNPKAVAQVPELMEATRTPVDPTQPAMRPDERALRAAASALSPEPDVIAVASGQGAILSRRSAPVQTLDDLAQLPLARAALEGAPGPTFGQLQGRTYRFAAARIPGSTSVAVVGTLIDDRLAARLRSLIDADVTLLQRGAVVASSVASAEDRARLVRWATSPSAGFGVLQVRLPFVGTMLSGKLPRGTARWSTRGALLPLDAGMQAAVTVPAGPYFGWLARYQAEFLVGLLLFALVSLVWGLLAPSPVVPAPAARAAPSHPGPTVRSHPRPPTPAAPHAGANSLIGTDVSPPRETPPPPARKAGRDVPWLPGEGPSGEHAQQPPSGEYPIPRPSRPPLPSAEPSVIVSPSLSSPRAEPSPAAPAPAPKPAPAPFEMSAAAKPPAAVELDPAWETPVPPPSAAAEDPFAFGDAPLPAAEPLEAETVEEVAEPVAPTPPAAIPLPSPGPVALPDSRPRAEAAPKPAAQSAEPARDERFSFAGLMETDGGAATPDAPRPVPLPARVEPEVFPGDEPTRIEAVSAALLEKLREQDEAYARRAAGQAAAEPAPARPAESKPAPLELDPPLEPASVLSPPTDDAPAAAEEGAPPAGKFAPAEPPPAAEPAQEPAADPDEAHWQETYSEFRALRERLGEPADRMSYDRFAAKLRKNREDLLAKHGAKGVRFAVYEKDGKAAIRAKALR